MNQHTENRGKKKKKKKNGPHFARYENREIKIRSREIVVVHMDAVLRQHNRGPRNPHAEIMNSPFFGTMSRAVKIAKAKSGVTKPPFYGTRFRAMRHSIEPRDQHRIKQNARLRFRACDKTDNRRIKAGTRETIPGHDV